MNSEDEEFISQCPELLEYIEEYGDQNRASQLKDEFENMARNGADAVHLHRFKRKVMRAKHKAERLIA